MKTLIFTLACVLLVVPCQAQIVFVDADANGANDGSSWANAYNHLQDALAEAGSHPDVNEIRVGQGIYKPDQTSADPNGSGDRTAMFQVINGVVIKGGYAGFGAPNPNARNINIFRTILSGDLDGNDVDVNDPLDLLGEPTRQENSYHVVRAGGTDANAVLDGFTITAGNANGSSPHDNGGGMHNFNSSATVINCTFSGNAAHHGGGMENIQSDPNVTNCTFSGNSADHGGGMHTFDSGPTVTNCTFSGNLSDSPIGLGGGGMCNEDSTTMVTNCTFSENSADRGGGMHNYRGSPIVANCTFGGNSAYWGGGMANERCSPRLTNLTFSGNSARGDAGGMENYPFSSPILANCTFSGNSAERDGGAMDNFESSNPRLINCTFSGNSARDEGGGMRNYDNSRPRLTNCTFSGNSADDGGGMYNDNSTPVLTHCILWGGTPDEIVDGGSSSTTVNYSDVQGGWPGLGNISADPCFVDPGRWVDVNDPNILVEPNDPNAVWVDGDYHLKSEGWYWDSVRRLWDYDEVTSRCIDAGNPGSPFGGELLTIPDDPGHNWGINVRINMGAYGGTAQASMPPYDWALLADITNDGIVDGRDYAHQAKDWLTIATGQPGDLNKNGVVNIRDLALFVDDWLETTSWY